MRDKCAELGITFQTWQDGAGRIILAKRADGVYATTIGGTVISIPRQVGKTFLVGAIVFALCLLVPGLTVIWTAHRLRTAEETFESMRGMAQRRRIKPHIEKIVLGSGEEEVRFKNGSRIMFGARERGFGRGFDEVDVLIFDEAQILTDNAIDDMVPATNQTRQAAGALLLFMGTPPKPTDAGEVFQRKRQEALSGEDEDTAYIEFSADDGFVPTAKPQKLTPADWEQVAKANPSYPDFTPRTSILRMRKNLSAESFPREGLGIWDGSGPRYAIPSWSRRVQLVEPEPAALGLAMDLDRVWLSLAASSAGDVPHLGSVLRVRADSSKDELLAVAARIVTERGLHVVIDAKGPAASLEADLKSVGISVGKRTLVRASFDDYVQACADLYDDFEAGLATHGDYPDLNDAVRAAGWRAGDRRVWTRKKGDVSMLEAATLAKWGATTGAPKPQVSMSY